MTTTSRVTACPYWAARDYAALIERLLTALAKSNGRTWQAEARYWQVPGRDRPITYPLHRKDT